MSTYEVVITLSLSVIDLQLMQVHLNAQELMLIIVWICLAVIENFMFLLRYLQLKTLC